MNAEEPSGEDVEGIYQEGAEQGSDDFDYAASAISSYDESLAQSRFKATFALSQLPVIFLSLITFANGLSGLFGLLFQRLSRHPVLFDMVVPYGIYHWSRGLSLLFGFILIYLSFHLLMRKRASFYLALAGLAVSLVLHLLRARMELHSDSDFINESVYFALLPIVLNMALLIIYRKRFVVKSETSKIKTGVQFLISSLLVAFVYGTLGFYFLDKREFGINFQLSDALLRTLREFLLIGNSDIVPQTTYAVWFLDSLRLSGTVAAVFALYSLFRPIEYRLRTKPREQALAARILEKFGRDALDYYKLLPDKSYKFSASGNCLIAYKTCLSVSVCLGDITGPDEEVPDFLKAVLAWCHENAWTLAFLQTGAQRLDLYKGCSLSALKVGEDAVVDLEKFASSTCKKKDFKNRVRKFEKDGFSFELLKAPQAELILDELEEVSNEWLSLPGRRERSFSLGVFERAGLKKDNVYVVKDPTGKIVAFVNQVRSYRAGEASIDLMRHRHELPNGTMDYLFVKLLLSLHESSFKTFNLGLAALSGVGESADANMHEKAVHQIYEHMNRFFSYKGLRNYKNKFEPNWEPRYLIYEGGTPGLIRTALAILDAAEPE